jgi:hypothetical protein
MSNVIPECADEDAVTVNEATTVPLFPSVTLTSFIESETPAPKVCPVFTAPKVAAAGGFQVKSS